MRSRFRAAGARLRASRRAGSPLEHLRFGLELLLYLLDLAATRKHPRLDDVLLRCVPELLDCATSTAR